MKRDTYTVYYRIGGTENFEWRRTVAFATKDEAIQCVLEIERGGRVAHYAPTNLLNKVGLPDTFEYQKRGTYASCS